jgi:SnoaL-like domain
MTGEAAHQTRLERILGARLAEDAVRQWPQSGERIDGRARIGEVEAHFVGLRLGVGRRHVSGDTIVVEWSTDYGDGRVYRNVSIAELRDGQAIRVTDYWGEPFTPPGWRQALAIRLDMPRDGVWPASPPCPAWHAR